MSVIPARWAAASRWSGSFDLRCVLKALKGRGFLRATPGELAAAGLPPRLLGQLQDGYSVACGHQWRTLESPDYPRQLLELEKPPPVVFLRGRAELLDREGLAVVGSRRCTPYGRQVARSLGRGCAERGATLISGAAFGIDTAAHVGALELEGPTLAVLAQGLDVEAGGDSGGLHRRILEGGGLLVSERLPLEPATRWAFPRRNRLIAALGRATVVVEAGKRSGALYTAEAAGLLGRDVFAVPGRIDVSAAAGTNQLLVDGAQVLANLDRVLKPFEVAASPQARLRAALPGNLPELSRRTGLAPRQVLSLLSAWELTQQVRLLPSGSYALVQ
ncbi:MAG: DNA-processing protein DprA [Myxococcota bacterium]|nr:DNA-processing protein DprA [Myxococcota bacterium]